MSSLSYKLLNTPSRYQYCGFSLEGDGRGKIKIWDNLSGNQIIEGHFSSVYDVEDAIRTFIQAKL